MNAAQRAYAALYSPTAEDLRRGLPEIAEGLQSQLMGLYARPDVDAATHVAANLAGAQRAVLRLRERLIAEGQGDGR